MTFLCLSAGEARCRSDRLLGEVDKDGDVPRFLWSLMAWVSLDSVDSSQL